MTTWLEDKKELAKASFDKLAWPDPKNEAYRRTDLSFLQNGHSFKTQSFGVETFGEHPGLQFCSLNEAINLNPGLVRNNLFSTLGADRGRLEALQALWATEGVFLYANKGARVDEPIRGRLTFNATDSQKAFAPRTLMVLEANAKVIYIEEHQGQTREPAIHLHGTEIILNEGAELTYIVIQNLGSPFKSLSFSQAKIGAGARLQIFHLELGASLRRVDIACDCLGTQSASEVIGAVFASASQNFDAHIVNRHHASQTRSDMLWKAALRDKAVSSFLGSIQIYKGADGSEAFQACHNLLLSTQARANPDPRLEIWASDVKAKHAATVGYLDPEAKFYLESRGIKDSEVEQLMTLGFLKEATGRVADVATRAILEAQLEKTQIAPIKQP